MKRSLLLLLVLALTVMAFALVACGEEETATTAGGTATTASSGTDGEPVYGGTMTVLISEFPGVMGNIENWGSPKSLMAACLEQLATFDPEGNLVPVLATSWDVDSAAKTITIHLREGVKFHDGTDFDADAAKWNYDQWLQSRRLSGRELITSCEVVDDHTIVLNCSEYSAMYLTAYLQYPYFLSPTYVDSVSLEESAMHPVGTGPFMIDSLQAGSTMNYVRFDDYWDDDLPYLDGYNYIMMTDRTSGAMMLEAGQADMLTAVAPKDMQHFIDEGYGYFVAPGFAYAMFPNSADPSNPLSVLEVRQAIECALDREAISQALGYGYSVALDSFVPEFSRIYPDDYTPNTYDPNRAKDLLAEAGYGDGFETSLVVRNDDLHRDFATAVQGYLADVGITLNIDIADNARYDSLKNEGTFDGLYLGQVRIEPGNAFVQGYLRDVQPGGICQQTVRSDEYIDIYEKLIVAQSDEDLVSLGKQLAKQASEDVMTINVCTFSNLVALRPGVHSTYMIAAGNFTCSGDWKEQ